MTLSPRVLALLAAVLAPAAFGTRVIEQPEGAYEADLDDVTLPASPAGHVLFRACATCSDQSMRVTSQTRYVYERAVLPFADFVLAAEEARRKSGPGGTAVYVFYDVETKRVNRLVVDRLDE